MSHAVLLGMGKYADEVAGFSSENEPQKEFIAIAKATGARVFSLKSSEGRYQNLFLRLFKKRPHIGSALKFCLSARGINACYVTGEDIGIPAAFMLAMSGWNGKLYCVVHNITPKKARLFRLIGHRIFGGIIIVSERQRRLLIEQCGIPAHKVFFRHVWVDDTFFTPAQKYLSTNNVHQPVVMACGAENRDYATLSEAARRLDIQFEIYGHGFFGIDLQKSDAPPPPNFCRMPRVSFPDLARAYHRASAVVLPLNNVAYAAGVTGLVEAMACGKTVIVTKTEGLEGYLDAIDATLLIQPSNVDHAVKVFNIFADRTQEENEAAGLENRKWILENCAIGGYVEFVKDLMNYGSTLEMLTPARR